MTTTRDLRSETTPRARRRGGRGAAGRWRRALWAFAILAVGCGESWKPVTYVERLRVLAIRAEPPDLAPGTSTQLSALVLDPNTPNRTNTLLWFACDPDPKALGQPACAQFASLEDASQLDAATQLPEGVKPLGVTCARTSEATCGSVPQEAVYRSPPELFQGLDPSDPMRTRGAFAVVLVLAVAESLKSYPPSQAELTAMLERVQKKEVPSQLVLKRLRISEEPQLNRNPAIEGLRIGGEFTRDGLRPLVKLRAGDRYASAGIAAEGAAELYRQPNAEGTWVDKQEKLFFSWFSTLGAFESSRTEANQENQAFTIVEPPQELPSTRTAFLYLVLRDGRGGARWITRGLYVCDPAVPAPVISATQPASGPAGTRVTLRGTGLNDVLDVRVGAGFLAALRYEPELGALVGSIPSDLSHGPHTLTVRGRGCAEDPHATFTVTEP